MKLVARWSLLLLAVATAAGADLVRLDNGKTMEGRFRRLEDGQVEIQTEFGSFRLAADRVVAVERSDTLEERLYARLAALDMIDAEGRYALALEARGERASTLERRLLEETLRADPDHARARADLGYHRWKDGWVAEPEWRRLRGEVEFRGRWVRAAERDAVLAEEERARRESADRRQELLQDALLQARLAMMEAEIRRLERQQSAHEAWQDEIGIVTWLAPGILWPPRPPAPPVPEAQVEPTAPAHLPEPLPLRFTQRR